MTTKPNPLRDTDTAPAPAVPELLDVTVRVARNIAGPYNEGDILTLAHTDLVDAWIRAGAFELVEDEGEKSEGTG